MCTYADQVCWCTLEALVTFTRSHPGLASPDDVVSRFFQARNRAAMRDILAEIKRVRT